MSLNIVNPKEKWLHYQTLVFVNGTERIIVMIPIGKRWKPKHIYLRIDTSGIVGNRTVLLQLCKGGAGPIFSKSPSATVPAASRQDNWFYPTSGDKMGTADVVITDPVSGIAKRYIPIVDLVLEGDYLDCIVASVIGAQADDMLNFDIWGEEF